MINNCQYFNFSKDNPEKLFDPFYKKDKVVIPLNKDKSNILTLNNARMIKCITAFEILHSKNYTIKDKAVLDIVDEIVDILTTTDNINYSPFSQFFMVYNTTYSFFKKLNKAKKQEFVYEMLIRYCAERHDIYLSHGYTDSILQVMCDNYSHKRNSKTTIEKILTILSPFNLKHISNINDIEQENAYFLPDKGDKKLFEMFLNEYNLKMQSRDIEQNKLPDIVFNCNGDFYICELKTMKGSGGGQNKQIVELAYFIKFSEMDSRFHYLAFLDGDYANLLFNNNSPKIKCQRDDVLAALQNNPDNYFVNTAGFIRLVQDIFC